MESCSDEKLNYLLNINEFLVYVVERGRDNSAEYKNLLARIHHSSDEKKDKEEKLNKFEDLFCCKRDKLEYEDLFTIGGENEEEENKCEVILEENLKLIEIISSS